MADSITPALRDLIGQPPDCAPGDLKTAAEYLTRITDAIARGGWTRSERVKLYHLRGKWRLRAEGKDPRFNVMGTRPGRLTADQEIRIRELRAAMHVNDTLRRTGASIDKGKGIPDALAFSRYGLDTPKGYAKGAPDVSMGQDEDPPYDDLAEPDDHVHGENFQTQGRRLKLLPRPEKTRVTEDGYFFVAASDKKGGKARLQCTIQPLYSRAIEEIVKSGMYGTLRTHGDFFRWAVYRGIEHLQNLTPNPAIKTVLHQANVINEIMLHEAYQRSFGEFVEGLDRQLQALKTVPDGTKQARQLADAVRRQLEPMPDGFWKRAYLRHWQDACGHLFDSRRNDGVSLTEFDGTGEPQ